MEPSDYVPRAMSAALARAGITSIAAAFAVACGLNNEGDPPPTGELYFPTALALSADADGDGAPDYLFTANSNFDLRYSSGSVQAFDLSVIDDKILTCESEVAACGRTEVMCRAACLAVDAGAGGGDADASIDDCDRCSTRSECAEPPDAGDARDEACDRCFQDCDDDLAECHAAVPYDDGKCFVDPTDDDVLAGDVRVGSFATSLALSPDGRDLFVVTRTDDQLTRIPIRSGAAGDGALDCGGGSRRCALQSTRPEMSSEWLAEWPGDPVDMVTGPLTDWTDADIEGDYVIVAHRRGAVSLFVEHGDKKGYLLTHTLQIENGIQITGVARDPNSGLLHLSLIANFSRVVLARVGVVVPEDPTQATLYNADFVALDGIEGASDTRAITFVEGIANSTAAFSGPRGLVLGGGPTSLLIVDVDPLRNEPGIAHVFRVTELGDGPARVVAGTIGAVGAEDSVQAALISCFDSREIFVVDLTSGEARSIVRNLSGPFELVLDGPRRRLYVADFRSSVVRVLDLAPIVSPGPTGDTSARLIATLGAPRVVQELK